MSGDGETAPEIEVIRRGVRRRLRDMAGGEWRPLRVVSLVIKIAALSLTALFVVTLLMIPFCGLQLGAKAKIGATVDENGNMVAVLRVSCAPDDKVYRVQLVSYDYGKRVIWDISSAGGSLGRMFTVGSVPPAFSENVPYAYDGSRRLQFAIDYDDIHDQESFSPGRLRYGRVLLRGDDISMEEFLKRDTCP